VLRSHGKRAFREDQNGRKEGDVHLVAGREVRSEDGSRYQNVRAVRVQSGPEEDGENVHVESEG